MRHGPSLRRRLAGLVEPWLGWSLNERRLLAGLLLFAALAMAARWAMWHTHPEPQPFQPPAGAEIP